MYGASPEPKPSKPVKAEAAKLVGQWRYDDKAGQIATYVFKDNGSYTAELRRDQNVVRKFSGLWRMADGMIVYTYLSDSLGQVNEGAVEKDRLMRIDADSYTIEAGDHLLRTYFRVK